MNRCAVSSTIVLVLSILVKDICHCQTSASLTCDQLPKREIPSIEDLVTNSPFKADFALTVAQDCSTRVVTNPARGTANYSGTVMKIDGSDVKVMDFIINSDRKSADTILCSTGEKSRSYLSAVQFDDKGSFYCAYTCNGTSLKEFLCVSNNNGTSPAELEAVNLARQVPNGNPIHDAKKNCPASKGCNVF